MFKLCVDSTWLDVAIGTKLNVWVTKHIITITKTTLTYYILSTILHFSDHTVILFIAIVLPIFLVLCIGDTVMLF